MNMLTKLEVSMVGQLRPESTKKGNTATSVSLPLPEKHGGLLLMEALAKRHSSCDFAPDPLPLQLLSNLLWAAYGINCSDGRRTPPSELNKQEIEMFVALQSGVYLYDAAEHELHLVASSDLRSITDYQDFEDEAPLNLVYVADHSRMSQVRVEQRESYASVVAGAIAQNVYLFAASSCLASVIRVWIDRIAIADALGLSHDQQVLLSQSIGFRC